MQDIVSSGYAERVPVEELLRRVSECGTFHITECIIRRSQERLESFSTVVLYAMANP